MKNIIYKTVFLILSFLIFSIYSYGQCNAPVLVTDSGDKLCEGSTINFSVSIPPLSNGCQLTNTPYKLYRDGNLIEISADNIFTPINSADEGEYHATVQIEDNGSFSCACGGTSPASNIITIYEIPVHPEDNDFIIETTCPNNQATITLNNVPDNSSVKCYDAPGDAASLLVIGNPFTLQNMAHGPSLLFGT